MDWRPCSKGHLNQCWWSSGSARSLFTPTLSTQVLVPLVFSECHVCPFVLSRAFRFPPGVPTAKGVGQDTGLAARAPGAHRLRGCCDKRQKIKSLKTEATKPGISSSLPNRSGSPPCGTGWWYLPRQEKEKPSSLFLFFPKYSTYPGKALPITSMVKHTHSHFFPAKKLSLSWLLSCNCLLHKYEAAMSPFFINRQPHFHENQEKIYLQVSFLLP